MAENLGVTVDTVIESAQSNQTVKVNNDATLTIASGAQLNADFLGAGNDNYFADPANAGEGGAVVVNGTANVRQASANNGGELTVAAGGKLNASETIAVEKGEIAEGTAGKMVVNGDVESTFLNVFNGGSVEIGATGSVVLRQHETDQVQLNLWGRWKQRDR